MYPLSGAFKKKNKQTNRVSLCNPNWPWTHDPSASASSGDYTCHHIQLHYEILRSLTTKTIMYPSQYLSNKHWSRQQARMNKGLSFALPLTDLRATPSMRCLLAHCQACLVFFLFWERASCGPGWPQTCQYSCPSLPSAGIISVHHHTPSVFFSFL
jgi:hypothetical protein